MAVLNTKLQVRNIKKFPIFDVSMVPNIVSANTNAPAIGGEIPSYNVYQK